MIGWVRDTPITIQASAKASAATQRGPDPIENKFWQSNIAEHVPIEPMVFIYRKA